MADLGPSSSSSPIVRRCFAVTGMTLAALVAILALSRGDGTYAGPRGGAGNGSVTTGANSRDAHPAASRPTKKKEKKPRGVTAAFSAAASRMSQSGVTCENGAGEDAIEACAGKSAGDACTVEREHHSFSGVCAVIPGEVLACQPPPPPPPSQEAIDACTGKVPGDACMAPTDDGPVPGLCKSFDSGVVACVPAPMSLQRAIDACVGKAAGDACTIAARRDHDDDDDQGEDEQEGEDDDHDDDEDAVSGACTTVPELGDALLCIPQPHVPPAVTACEGKASGDACSFEHDGATIDGQCLTPPGRTGLLCVPQRLIPPSVAACGDRSAGDACSFVRDDRTIDGNCAAIPGHDLLICVPPPPQALVDACSGKVEGDACMASLGEHDFIGACAVAADGVTLACLPRHRGDTDDDDDEDDDESPREAACNGLPAGALCSVTLGDRTQNGTCRRDDDDDDELECLPPAPPQEAIDACAGLADGDECSFVFRERTVSGACHALPGGSTLVCAPLCPHPRKDRDD